MRWTHLGHACWLAETADRRLLFDPLLGETYHDGVFEVFPRRALDLDALRADVVVVSHRHPDHFDVPSLATLARLGTVETLLTADALVARTARRLGFPEVRVLGPLEQVGWGETRLLTTPSYCKVVEWGAMVSTPDGVVWNQVDSVLGAPEDVRGVLGAAASLLEAPSLEEGPALTLARWHPLQQVNAHTSGTIGFPFQVYEGELRRLAALGPGAVVPGAAGNRYVGDHGWQNGVVYPVPEERLRRDLRRLRPEVTVFPSGPGLRVEVRGGRARRVEDAPWVRRQAVEDDRLFKPYVVPPIVEPRRHADAAARELLARWLREDVGPAVQRALPGLRTESLCCGIEVIFADAEVGWTLDVAPADVALRDGIALDHDVLNSFAAGPLLDVIAGRCHWGRPLLGGQMRSVVRAYRLEGDRVERLRLAPFVPYYWLPYDRATERWIEASVDRLLG